MYWYDFELRKNHYAFGAEPGTGRITNFSDQVVEGAFSFKGFNDQLEKTFLATGGYGIMLGSKDIDYRC